MRTPTQIKYRDRIYKRAEGDWPLPWKRIAANSWEYEGRRAHVIARQGKPGYYDLTATAGGVTFYTARKLFAPSSATVWHLQHLGEFIGSQGPWLGHGA